MCDAALARAFEFLGKRWNGVILGTLTVGPAGFAKLARSIPGISDSVLSERLSGLAKGRPHRAHRRAPARRWPSPTGWPRPARRSCPSLVELTRWASENLLRA